MFEGQEPRNFPGIFGFEWSGDGKSFFYPEETSRVVVHRDLESGAETKVAMGIRDDEGFRAFPAPNGKHIAFYTLRNNATNMTVNVTSAAAGAARQLVELRRPDYLPGYAVVGWTPDSRYVLFAKWNLKDLKSTSLWRVPVTGGEPENLGLTMERIQQPRISPDGRRIAFTAGTWKHEWWVMENFLPAQKVAVK